MTRADLRTYLRTLLGVESNDKLYTDTRLNLLLEQAHAGLVAEVRQAAPEFFTATITLTESGAGNTYLLTSQISNFAELLEVRVTNASGVELSQVRVEDLNAARGNRYALTGTDEQATILTSSDVTAAAALYVRYSYWPSAFTSDVAPPGIPSAFHELVGLEAIFVFELGGEGVLPKSLRERWAVRRQAFLTHVSNRIRPATKATDITTRAGVRSLVRGLLGARDDDPSYADASLNLQIQSAWYSIVFDLMAINPSYFETTASLTAEVGDAHQYVLPAGAGRLLEVRFTDSEGSLLDFTRGESLTGHSMAYTVEDDATVGRVIRTSQDADTGTIWIRYTKLPTAPTADATTAIDGIPSGFVDVLALEVAVLHNPALMFRHTDRRSQLMDFVSRPSTQPTLTRRVNVDEALEDQLM